MTRRWVVTLVAPIAALLFAFGVAAVALRLVGIDPLFAFSEMWAFARSAESLISMINRAVPLYVSALAVAIGFKMGLFNIGVEGQYLLAALFAAYVGSLFVLPPPLHVAAILLVASAVGAGWAGIAGLLKVKRGVHEVISTIMLNFIGFSFSAYLFLNFFKSGIPGLTLATDLLPQSAWMPSMNWTFGLFGVSPRSSLNSFVVLAALLGIGYHLLVTKSRFGFDLRASGINPAAARASGVNPGQMVLRTMLISGAIAGWVGMSHVLGFFHQYPQDFPRLLGFTGIAVALLGRNHPVGMALGALLFGLMERTSVVLDLRAVPREIVTIIQGVVVLAVVIAYEVISRIAERRAVRAAARATAELEAAEEPA